MILIEHGDGFKAEKELDEIKEEEEIIVTAFE